VDAQLLAAVPEKVCAGGATDGEEVIEELPLLDEELAELPSYG
jgi:hypothetical protein